MLHKQCSVCILSDVFCNLVERTDQVLSAAHSDIARTISDETIISALIAYTQHLEDLLYIVIQPKVHHDTECSQSYEVLVRMRGSVFGLTQDIAPARFIPLCESYSSDGELLVKKVDLFALRQACRLMHRWQCLGVKHSHVAVNLSRFSLNMPNILEAITRVLQEERYSDIVQQSLQIELTETGALLPESIARLCTLTTMNISIAVDDFVKQNANTEFLLKLLSHPDLVHTIKIDILSLLDVMVDEGALQLAILFKMLRAVFDGEIVVEGVETEAALERVIAIARSCNVNVVVQGYVHSRPKEHVFFEKAALN